MMDSQNENFWDELCGSQLAQSIGITDNTKESIKTFDEWYFRYYPYLWEFVNDLHLTHKDVLEVGLGYGSVTQLLAELGGKVTGLDVAEGPVQQARHRFQLNALAGDAAKASILDSPFSDESFDTVVAVGSLHHTGDLSAAISEISRVLRPDGELFMMVYNAYSYRRWFHNPFETAKYLVAETAGRRRVVGHGNAKSRAMYDSNSAGESAPHTDWISKRSLKFELREFERVRIQRNNIDQGFPFALFKRERLLETRLPAFVGLDLYAWARKSSPRA